MIDLSYINKKFKIAPFEINNGWCFVWALYAREQYPYAQLYTYDPNNGHAFVKINNKYYDAEAPKGEPDWKQLLFFKYIRPYENDLIKHNIYEFCRYWAMNGYAPLPKRFKKYWE